MGQILLGGGSGGRSSFLVRVDLSATCQTSRPDRDRRLNECHIRRSAAFAMAGDAEVARMRASGVPFRAIAAAMGMSLGGVQKSVRRAEVRRRPGHRFARRRGRGGRRRARPGQSTPLDARWMHVSGESASTIAATLGVSPCDCLSRARRAGRSNRLSYRQRFGSSAVHSATRDSRRTISRSPSETVTPQGVCPTLSPTRR